MNRSSLGDWRVFLATGFGFGMFPVTPGTIGALWGLPLTWLLAQIEFVPLRIAIIAAICGVGIPLCTAAARVLGAKDPGSITFDEIASLPLTFFLVPLDSAGVWIVGFALHRLFDITKPPPARRLERWPEGLGIMADDWIAGLYSCLALHLLRYAGIFT